MDETEEPVRRQAAEIRAGRSYLGWSQRRLAEASCLPVRTIVRMEAADGRFRRRVVVAVRVALGRAGVVVGRGVGLG